MKNLILSAILLIGFTAQAEQEIRLYEGQLAVEQNLEFLQRGQKVQIPQGIYQLIVIRESNDRRLALALKNDAGSINVNLNSSNAVYEGGDGSFQWRPETTGQRFTFAGNVSRKYDRIGDLVKDLNKRCTWSEMTNVCTGPFLDNCYWGEQQYSGRQDVIYYNAKITEQLEGNFVSRDLQKLGVLTSERQYVGKEIIHASACR